MLGRRSFTVLALGAASALAEDVLVSPGSVLVTLLSNSEFVNLGRRNQNIVEKGVALPSLLLVLSGLGASVKVTGADIPFDNGFIRPIDGSVSPSHCQAGLLAEIDSRASITVLAPDDSAFARISTDLPYERLKELLRRHVLVDFPAYTPLLQDGDVYSTLAGGQVTVSVANGIARVNGARILAGDAIITNGVIHTINSVLGASPAPSPPITAAATERMKPLSQMALACSLGGVVAASRYLFVL
ncbi:Fasciclin-domain-containing protein [Ophiocordyceps sinensis CO18]|uniref:Fasciclin-domain-containing protein n=1 Tax=Ophiocordyceps sinensis (strain Co18 / CGMCC 3.14243) TaxID=911162 RepID=T5AH16_OPHSC|nr:Fasciclin-domain-containing protein [Ophiocordyceps sinensis CO18]